MINTRVNVGRPTGFQILRPVHYDYSNQTSYPSPWVSWQSLWMYLATNETGSCHHHTQLQNSLKENTWLGSCCPPNLTQISVTIFLHMPCKLPSTSMLLLKMVMHAQNLLCMQFGNTHAINKILIWVIFSAVLMSHVVWKKAWRSFFRYTEFFDFRN